VPTEKVEPFPEIRLEALHASLGLRHLFRLVRKMITVKASVRACGSSVNSGSKAYSLVCSSLRLPRSVVADAGASSG
jgi:hypothetical protein